MSPRILIAIATYNEMGNLPELTRQVHEIAPDVDVLVIDDNSPDGTGTWAEQMAAINPWLKVLHRAGKLGLGTAILAGMRYAMQHSYDYLLTMDADFSHHPRYLPKLIAGMHDRDLMIGSRYIRGASLLDWPLKRRLMSAGVNSLVRLSLRVPAHDTSGNYRCYRVAMLRRAPLDKIISHGYSFQEEVLYRCCQAGSRVGETPIIFEERRAGASKVNRWEMIRSLGVIFWLGVSAIFVGNKA